MHGGIGRRGVSGNLELDASSLARRNEYDGQTIRPQNASCRFAASEAKRRPRQSQVGRPRRSRTSTAATANGVAADLDLAHAFADVAPLASGNRARSSGPPPPHRPQSALPTKPMPSPQAGAVIDGSPGAWDVGQETRGGTDLSPCRARGRRGVEAATGSLGGAGRSSTCIGTPSNRRMPRWRCFLAEARSHGWRCVRIIHGKGLSSPNREPVLKGKVRRWLTLRNNVLAYCEAPRHSGGSGAVLVLLMAPSATSDVINRTPSTVGGSRVARLPAPRSRTPDRR